MFPYPGGGWTLSQKSSCSKSQVSPSRDGAAGAVSSPHSWQLGGQEHHPGRGPGGATLASSAGMNACRVGTCGGKKLQRGLVMTEQHLRQWWEVARNRNGMSSAPEPEASPCDCERKEDTREGSTLAAFPESGIKREGWTPCHLLAWPTGAAQSMCRLQRGGGSRPTFVCEQRIPVPHLRGI